MSDIIKSLLDARYGLRPQRLHATVTAAPLVSGRSAGYVIATVGGVGGVRVNVSPDVRAPFVAGDTLVVEGVGTPAAMEYWAGERTAGARADSDVYQFPGGGTAGGTTFEAGDLLLGSTLADWSNWWYQYELGRWQIRQGTTMHGAIGDLDGLYGYSGAEYGTAFGEYGADKINITTDPTNGFRIRAHTTPVFQADTSGVVWALSTFRAGTGDDMVGITATDGTWRLYAGHETPGSAPFRVDKDGALTATGATITGSITATTGTIGGWLVGATTLETTGADIVLDSAQHMIQLGGGNLLSNGSFDVYTGTLDDGSGDTFAGWSKAGTVLAVTGRNGGAAVSMVGALWSQYVYQVVAAAASTQYTFSFWYKGGKLYRDLKQSDDSIYYDAGELPAVADWTFYTANFTTGGALAVSDFVIVFANYDADVPVLVDDVVLVKTGVTPTSYVRLTPDAIYGVSSTLGTTFRLPTDGSGPVFRGTITADAGAIGGPTGWAIATGKLTSTGIGMATAAGDATYAFWAGDDTPASAEFSVTHTGTVKATNATIGRWSVNANAIYTGTEDHAGYTANAGDITFYSNGTVASIHAFKFYVDNNGNLAATSATITGTVSSDNYVSGTTGWKIDNSGTAEFENITARGSIKTAVFQKSLVQAFAGSQVTSKSASTVVTDVTLGAGTFTLVVKQQAGAAPFANGDLVYLKTETLATYATVDTGSASGDNWSYTATYKSGDNAGTVKAGETVVDYGGNGDGRVIITADATNAPYLSIATHDMAAPPAWTERARLGLLTGISGASGYGLWTDNGFFTGAITANSGSIAGFLTLGASGGIYQGTGTAGSPTTGLKIWNDGGVGRIAGYNTSVLQWGADTDGKLKAGAGAVVLDVDGITMASAVAGGAGSLKVKSSTTLIGEYYVGRDGGYHVQGGIDLYNYGAAYNVNSSFGVYHSVGGSARYVSQATPTTTINTILAHQTIFNIGSATGTVVALRDNFANEYWALTNAGTMIGPAWKPASDSTTALQMQQADGTPVVTVDTANGYVGVGTTPQTPLDVYGEIVARPITSYASITGKGVAFRYNSVGGLDTGELTAYNWSGYDYANFRIEASNLVINAASSGPVGVGTTAPASAFHTLLTDAGTNAVANVVTIGHNTSGTAAAGFGAGLAFQLESSTTAAQDAALVSALWYEATHATRKADLVLSAYDTTVREGVRIRGNGSAPAIGFLGATPVARQAHIADATDAATVITRVNAVIAALETFGLLATS